MKSIFSASALLCTLLAATTVAQTPVIGGLENNYSYVVPGLPNYGIAQGSIFDIFGSNLASSSTGLQNPPLQTTLNGASAAVTVSGTTKQVLLYYVTPSQIAAILPSGVPVGTGTITVTNNGQTSAPAQIVVVQGAFGILTLNGLGSGPAAAFDVKYNYLGSANAANPGDTILLWGTGAGPVPNDNQQSATTAPLEVDIGGIAGTVVYQGRSQYAGLDQIDVVVPAGVSGCYVSVVVRSGNYVSNFSSIPVATSGRTCSDAATTPGGLSTTQLQSVIGKSTVRVGVLGLSKTTSTTPAVVVGGVTITPASTTSYDFGFGSFSRITLPQNYDPYVAQGVSNTTTSIGSCTVYALIEDTSAPPPTPTTPIPTTTSVSLNAGPVINVSGPNGKKSMPLSNGVYSAQLGGDTGVTTLPVFIPATGGTFTFDNGSGGPDVGAFTAQLALNPIVWTNSTIITINRSQGQSVTWTGGDPNTYVSITGESYISSGTKFLFGSFTCTAPAAAHQFTIPAAVLLALPPSGSISAGSISIPQPGTLSVISFTGATTFTAPGIDLAYAYAYSGSGASITYQ